MIYLKNVTKIYGENTNQEVRALDNIKLSIDKGEFVAIVGASGSGKSTIMNILGMLDRPTNGEYFLGNKDVNSFSDEELAKTRNSTIGFVFQKFHLLPKTSAIENVELPLLYSDKKNVRESAFNALKNVGLEDRINHRPNELSGGQQQRVAIARALVNDPEILLADEPTGNLDSKSTMEVMEIFNELNRSGRTIILITHEWDIAEQADRVITIQDGKMISDFRKDENNVEKKELAEMKN